MATYYHVVPAHYQDGEPLWARDAYIERYGEAPSAWKWEDAEEGFDGDIISLFSGLIEAREYQAAYGGRILTIAITPDDPDIRVIRNSEGYAAVVRVIPARYIGEEVR